ncbi:putative quinol monooxygenase [Salinibacterium sp. ZJ454]|uniref:putative quinol monooxygenase n=1 Tax=Salinibacterium sp. ZJ454 TaxID=2708339 RepID=UPI0014244CD3|nr:putative quinol monooxygenase [Salinibacterium sp. ZJ454]
MAELQVIARYTVLDGKSDEVKQLLLQLQSATRAEQANLAYDVSQDITDCRRFVILERYVNAAGFDQHLGSDHFISLAANQIVPLLERREVERIAVEPEK